MKIKFKVFAQITVVAFFAVACSKDPDSAGLEYMPDMYRSPAIEPYVDYGEIREQEKIELKMQLSALTPPSFTIPYLGIQIRILNTKHQLLILTLLSWFLKSRQINCLSRVKNYTKLTVITVMVKKVMEMVLW